MLGEPQIDRDGLERCIGRDESVSSHGETHLIDERLVRASRDRQAALKGPNARVDRCRNGFDGRVSSGKRSRDDLPSDGGGVAGT